MNIFLLRHGKTLSNIRGAFTGSRDEPLAREGADELDGRRYPAAGMVFSSPMRRCVETAERIYPGAAVIIVDDLRERDFGDFEGKTHADIIALPGFSDWGMNEKGMMFPNGEDFAEFLERCRRAFRETLARIGLSGVENAAIVCHGGVIMAILSELALPKRGYHYWQCKNGSGYVLECDGEKVEVKGSICG